MKSIKKVMSTFEIITILELLQKFIQKDMRMPGTFSWALEDNLEILEKIKAKFLKSRGKIENEFVEDQKVVDSKNEIKEEFKKEFQDRLNELLSIENTIKVQMVPFSVIEGKELSSQEVKCIKFMIERGEKLEKTDNTNE